jgi:large subunit ribosomal protein L29
MKIADIRQMADEEIKSELERLRRSLFDLRSSAVTEKLQDPAGMTKTKRDVARLMTVWSERRNAAAAKA